MSQSTTKTGISMSRIENTNTIKSLKCNCKKCFHSTVRDGALICNYYNKVGPTKRYCKRFIQEEGASLKDSYIVINAKGRRLRDFTTRAEAVAYAAQVNAKVTNKEDAVLIISGKEALKNAQKQKARREEQRKTERAKNGPSKKLDTP